MRRKDIIQKKIKEAKVRYDKEVGFNKSAWDTYGSELCAGSMVAAENTILREVEHLETLLGMPEIDMNQEALSERSDAIKEEILRLRKEMDDLERKKSTLEAKKTLKEGWLARITELNGIPLET